MSCDISYEELAGFADAELEAGRLNEIREHLAGCDLCRERLDALGRADAVLAAIKPAEPSAAAVLAARREFSEVIRPSQFSEIMTLSEAAEFLRITADQLGEIAEELPAFELAGQIRLRRERLLEWIEQRERDYTRQASESWAARSKAISFGIGVA